MSRTKVSTIICPKCGDQIYSRARHDFRSCTCNSIFIDGGFNYVRMGGELAKKAKIVGKFINVSKTELYEDWNYDTEKYGVIKHGTDKQQRKTSSRRKLGTPKKVAKKTYKNK